MTLRLEEEELGRRQAQATASSAALAVSAEIVFCKPPQALRLIRVNSYWQFTETSRIETAPLLQSFTKQHLQLEYPSGLSTNKCTGPVVLKVLYYTSMSQGYGYASAEIYE